MPASGWDNMPLSSLLQKTRTRVLPSPTTGEKHFSKPGSNQLENFAYFCSLLRKYELKKHIRTNKQKQNIERLISRADRSWEGQLNKKPWLGVFC